MARAYLAKREQNMYLCTVFSAEYAKKTGTTY